MVVKQREDALGGARMVEALGTFGGGSEQSLGGQFEWVGEHRLRGEGGGRCGCGLECCKSVLVLVDWLKYFANKCGCGLGVMQVGPS